MKDGAILCQHRATSTSRSTSRRCASLAVETRQAREFVEEFPLADGRRLYLIADGRLVNLAAAEGHPALVMDMSFANQALAAEYAVQNAATLERKVYPVPRGDRPRDRPPQARDDGHRDRPADGGAGEVPRLLGRGHLSRSCPVRPMAGALTPGHGPRLARRARADGSSGWRSDARRPPRPAAPAGRGGRARVPLGGRGRRGDPRRSRSAARPRSASPRLRATRSRRCAATTSTRPTACSRRRGRPRSTSPGRSTSCAATRPAERARELHARGGRALPPDGGHAAELLGPGTRALTHCNAGGLATGGYGTRRRRAARRVRARPARARLVDETRPLLQGARLTAGSSSGRDPARGDRRLRRRVADGARARSTASLTGADRIAANGDTANKIGTYSLAVLAAPPRHPALRRRAELDGRPGDAATARGDPDRGARPRRGHARASPRATPPST